MTQRRRLTSSAFVVALITTFLLPGPVSAADTSEVESLRNEVRQLQAQLQALRSAVVEATELEGRRSANLAKQMREPQGAPVAQSAPPVASAETLPPSREIATIAAAAAEDKPARAKQRRKHTSRSRWKASKVKRD